MVAPVWNGVSLLSSLTAQTPATVIYSDASGTWGCGAVCQSDWFQLKWDSSSEKYHISIKELIPTILATAVWGHHFRGKALHIKSDNVTAVAAINHQSSSVKEITYLLRCLAFIVARFQIWPLASHILEHTNELADALSRNNMMQFFSLFLQANETPLPVPK